jgi:thioesterase domain-containing protein
MLVRSKPVDGVAMESFMREHIPLAEVMDVEIAHLDNYGIRLRLPLQPSINDKGSAFGGALSSALLLAGWGLVSARVNRLTVDYDVVIHTMQLQFNQPIYTDFTVTARFAEGADVLHFEQALAQRGKARIAVLAEARIERAVATQMQASFVALRRPAEQTAPALP